MRAPSVGARTAVKRSIPSGWARSRGPDAACPARQRWRSRRAASGHAVSSIFLAREFGVTVWAVDRGVDPTENLQRIATMGCEDRVFPLRVDVRALPFPHAYFDAAIAVDSYPYFGTDERFLPFLARH